MNGQLGFASAPILSLEVNTLAMLAVRVTPVILTFNEGPNIERSLKRLAWAKRVVVVDSGSTDTTRDLCAMAGNVDWFVRPFDSHAAQWTFAVECTGIETEWVMALDADYILSDELVENLKEAVDVADVAGWRCHFEYMINGRVLPGSLYPPVVALFRRGKGRYRQDGHTQRLELDGPLRDLGGVIYHDDRKPLSRWFSSQAKYARLEAEHLLNTEKKRLGFADKLRLMVWPAPFAVLLHVLLVRGCIFGGWSGWYYALQRMLAEIMLALELIDHRLQGRATSSRKGGGC